MKSVSTQYSKLVRDRGVIFPDFQSQQEQSARDLYATLRPYLEAGSISTIVDIGCGTGEILSSLAEFIERDRLALKSKVLMCGFDANKKSIVEARQSLAHQRHPLAKLQFCVSKPEAILFDEIDAWKGASIPNADAYDRMAIICSGHTFFHLQYLPALFEQLISNRIQRPKIWIIDVYHCWDRILEEIEDGEHLEKRSERVGPKGRELEYALFSRKSPEGADKLERGLYEISGGPRQSRREIISTIQWAWSESELAKRFAAAGYSIAKRNTVDSGYGKMIRIVFSLPMA